MGKLLGKDNFWELERVEWGREDGKSKLDIFNIES